MSLVSKEALEFINYIVKNDNNGVLLHNFEVELKLDVNKNRIIHLLRHLYSTHNIRLGKYNQQLYIDESSSKKYNINPPPDGMYYLSTGRDKVKSGMKCKIRDGQSNFILLLEKYKLKNSRLTRVNLKLLYHYYKNYETPDEQVSQVFMKLLCGKKI